MINNKTKQPLTCYQETDPARISAIAKLYGIEAPDYSKANVLEIGCASGGNLIPLASRYSGGSFRGIDMSKSQITLADQQKKKLDLENINFEVASVLDIEFGSEKFDYIIAHRFYSWVDNETQSRLLEICKNHLSPLGVALISYNTLPGWNTAKTIRDMMRYHAELFENQEEKVDQACKMLNFIADNNQIEDGHYKQLLNEELGLVQELDSSYLMNDYLAKINQPCYFHEFNSEIRQHKLSYLTECNLPSIYLDNFKQAVIDKLSSLDDQILQEQYFDFIMNRKFRTSLIVHENTTINRKIVPNSVVGLFLKPLYKLEKELNKDEILNLENLNLIKINREEKKIQINGFSTSLCYLALLNATPHDLTMDEIIKQASILNEKSSIDNIRNDFTEVILHMIFSGMVSISSAPPAFVNDISEKPKVFEVARLSSLDSYQIPNMRHETITLTADQRLCISHVNGENTKE